MSAPVLVLNPNSKRESGRKVQMGNVSAAKNIADVIRTCLGPRSMLKMLMDPMGGIVMTNDGNAILREITVQHPAAKTMIEISRTQDEEVGDGTTSVIILAGEMMSAAQKFLEQNMHPTVIISAYRKALEDMQVILDDISVTVDTNNQSEMKKIVKSAIGTKLINQWCGLACEMAIKSVATVMVVNPATGAREIDIKRYAKVEKVPGGSIEDSKVLDGVMLNKDVTHPSMKRKIEKPRVLLLDCGLEYQKGESQTDLELSKDTDFERILQMEEEYIKRVTDDIIKLKPDLIFTEKGISDLAQYYLAKAGITAIRRVRKSDNNRIARACGATICSRTEEAEESDIGTDCGMFEVKKLGDEYFTFLTKCKDPKACTILLRGASKDILMEIERNLQDAMQVARNVMINPKLLPGGGAVELALSQKMLEKAKLMTGVEQHPYKAVAHALEVIPRTLLQNCGASTIRVLTKLRAEHVKAGKLSWGVDGESGEVCDMNKLQVWEPLSVKLQTYKTAMETAMLLLRIDDIVSGTKKAEGQEGTGNTAPTQ